MNHRITTLCWVAQVALCATCSGTPPGFDMTGDLAPGTAASLLMLPGALVHVGGHFDRAINSNTRFNMAEATLQMEGTGQEQTLEVRSIDLGVDPSGLDRTFTGHYPIGTLQIDPSPSTLHLVDNHDNDGLGQGTREGIYIDQLVRDTGSRLDNTQRIIDFNTLINNGTIEVPENVIPLIPPCPTDFNQDGGVDDSDINAFFEARKAGKSSSDVNGDGGVDGGDVEMYFVAWEAGGCEWARVNAHRFWRSLK